MSFEEDFIIHSRLKAGEDFLAHYGKPGMKWGVKRGAMAVVNARQVNAQKNIDIRKRVAAGKGSKIDKLRVAATASPYDLVRQKGLAGASKKYLERTKKRQERLNKITKGNKVVENILFGLTGIKGSKLKV